MEFWREEFASIDRFLEIRSSPSVKTVPSPSSDLKRGEKGKYRGTIYETISNIIIVDRLLEIGGGTSRIAHRSVTICFDQS